MNDSYLVEKFGLSEKIAMVIGGGGAIGREIALGMSKAGAQVIIADYNFDSADSVASCIDKSKKKTSAIQVNINNSQEVSNMVENVKEKFGNIDILVNCAGISKNIPAEEMPDKVWNQVINTNLTGTFFCCREVGKIMIQQKSGCIINIVSMSGTIVNKGRNNANYCASKGGLKMLTKALAEQWSKYNIRVNSISPGYIRTPMTKDFINEPKFNSNMQLLTPLQRVGEPEELVGLALYLASDASSFMTGADILIDGGYTVL